MKIRDLFEAADGKPIDYVKAKVLAVYDPDTPSEAQRNHGIHSQSIKLGGSDGSSIFAQIIEADLHLPKSAEGEVFVFESNKNGHGNLSGVKTNIYFSKKKNKEVTKLVIDRWASIYQEQKQPEENKEGLPKANGSAPANDAKAIGDKLIERFGNVFENAVEAVVLNSGPDVILNAFGKAVATVLKNNGVTPGREGSRPAQAPPQKPEGESSSSPSGKSYDTVKTEDGKIISSLSKPEFIALFVQLAHEKDNLDGRGGELLSAAKELRKDKNLPWSALYDHYANYLDSGHGENGKWTRTQINQAYDLIRESTGIRENEMICREVITNQGVFEKILVNMSGQADPNAAEDPDNIPF